jgi:small-conductance mechanosensitive channel
MEPRARLAAAVAGFVALTLAGVVSLYQLLFALWMTAYPFADANEWRMRVYVRLVITIAIASCWCAMALRFHRRRRRN